MNEQLSRKYVNSGSLVENRIPRAGSSYSDIRIERLGPMRVASYVIESKNAETEAASFLRSWMKRNGIRTHQQTRAFFLEIGGEQGLTEAVTGYEYWVTVPGNVSESEGVVIKDIQAADYAVLRIYSPFCDDPEGVIQGWKNLHDWVINSKHKAASGPQTYLLEEIIENDQGRCLDIYYPIKINARTKNVLQQLTNGSHDSLLQPQKGNTLPLFPNTE